MVSVGVDLVASRDCGKDVWERELELKHESHLHLLEDFCLWKGAGGFVYPSEALIPSLATIAISALVLVQEGWLWFSSPSPLLSFIAGSAHPPS